MGLLDIIDKGLIINPLTSVKKEDIIRDLVDLYCDRKSLGEDERDAIFKAVIDREMIASTAMEKGIAIPHAKIPFLKESAIVIGVHFSGRPQDFFHFFHHGIFFQIRDHLRSEMTLCCNHARAGRSSDDSVFHPDISDPDRTEEMRVFFFV